MKNLRKINQSNGFTILEVLIAGLITAIIVASAFSFYTKMHLQSEVQFDVSEMKQLSRTSLYDIRKCLLQAGFKTAGHVPYEIKADTLAVYYSETKPVDSIKYFLQEFTDAEYADVPDLPAGTQLYKLMKQENSQAPVIFADFLTAITYTMVNPDEIDVGITVMAPRKDDSYEANGGFRLYTINEKINVRNVE